MKDNILKFHDSSAVNTGVSEAERHAAARALSEVLASSYTLFLKTQYYHWNIIGGHFYGLHHLFEEQYRELFEAVDELAERIRALGMGAPGTFREFAKLSNIEEDSSFPRDAKEMVENLEHGHEKMAKLCRHVIHENKDEGDEVTIDMLTRRVSVHEKASWMLRSFLEEHMVSEEDEKH